MTENGKLYNPELDTKLDPKNLLSYATCVENLEI